VVGAPNEDLLGNTVWKRSAGGAAVLGERQAEMAAERAKLAERRRGVHQ